MRPYPSSGVSHRLNRRIGRREGQALIEFTLMMPLLLILIVNIVNFAGFFCAFVAVGNASRSAGDYTIMGSGYYPGAAASLTAPSDELSTSGGGSRGTAGGLLVANMIAKDMLSLPNRNSITVRVCESPGSDTSSPSCNYCTNTGGSMSCTCYNSGGTSPCSRGTGSAASNPTADASTGEGGIYTLTWVDITYTYQPFIPATFTFSRLHLGVTLPNNLVLHRQSVYRVMD
jgi:Flp pilus assembly protein TadG